MAQFRGIVQGNRGEASRLGSKSSGMRTDCDTWDVGVMCHAQHANGQDLINVYRTSGSGSALSTRWIATVYPDGTIDTRAADGSIVEQHID